MGHVRGWHYPDDETNVRFTHARGAMAVIYRTPDIVDRDETDSYLWAACLFGGSDDSSPDAGIRTGHAYSMQTAQAEAEAAMREHVEGGKPDV